MIIFSVTVRIWILSHYKILMLRQVNLNVDKIGDWALRVLLWIILIKKRAIYYNEFFAMTAWLNHFFLIHENRVV